MKNRKEVLLFLAILFFGCRTQAGTWTALDYPGAYETFIFGIDNGTLLGSHTDYPYNTGEHAHGAVYNMASQNWTTLDMPDVPQNNLMGKSGTNYIGWYDASHGTTYGNKSFLYNGTTWTTLNVPDLVRGISGNYIVGSYTVTNGVRYGFCYDILMQKWTALGKPGAINTVATGIDGNRIVGNYSDSSGWHSFIYDTIAQNWNTFTLAVPGAYSTGLIDISGDKIIGQYYDNSTYWAHNFIYDISTQTYTTIDMPGAFGTYVSGIEGNNIVGYYKDYESNSHGFLYTIPEPATFLLISFGGLLLRKNK